ncbi:uncharacterized protein LOC120281255 [Dioscorea cayenensis subsp. rotundata]|uniref:Uncharacterized protein LOC120281255 n=1 Tax=Dioscorea cayennensis subsp. rotundata TaxID=55577 RepID=A0AB40CXZ1_DIOCR|nr:uncharacterized protein LOC120281255 [Dioscorea cayenensis subsp. rotundata]
MDLAEMEDEAGDKRSLVVRDGLGGRDQIIREKGISKRDSFSRIKFFMKKYKPLIFCLVETRADNGRLAKFCSKLSKRWAWAAIVAEGYSGGIIVAWQRHIGKVTPLVRSRFVLHLVITNCRNESWIISTIYNSTHIQEQSDVWFELSCLTYVSIPWILIGDFNAIVSLSEFQGGSPIYYRRKARVFSDFIAINNLIEVNFASSSYTWCNNQLGNARKWARLDRCLINSLSIDFIGSYIIKHLPMLFSDHAPLLLTLTPRVPIKKKIFRFDNFWLEYLDCHDVVRETWSLKPHSNPLHAFSHLLSRARTNLIAWKNRDLNSIEASINKLELEILEAEALEGLNGNITYVDNALSPLYNRLTALHRQNSTKWAQRARQLWVLKGDLNTNFFHNSIHCRNHVNSIPLITNDAGVVVTDQKGIEKVFSNFYMNLWADPSDNSVIDIFQALPSDLPLILAADGVALTKEVTKLEVILFLMLSLTSLTILSSLILGASLTSQNCF